MANLVQPGSTTDSSTSATDDTTDWNPVTKRSAVPNEGTATTPGQLAMPDPLDVDTRLDVGSNATVGLEAPSEDNLLPMATFDDFQNNTVNSSMAQGGFSAAMRYLSDSVYNQNSNDEQLPTGGTATGTRGQLISYAKQFLGTPYVWGGSAPGGFDCSGFVQYVEKKFGNNLPRISADQARSGPHIALKDLQPGDLIAWDENDRNNGADHIAIYIGNGQFIEAPHTGADVRISSLKGRESGAWGVRMNYK